MLPFFYPFFLIIIKAPASGVNKIIVLNTHSGINAAILLMYSFPCLAGASRGIVEPTHKALLTFID